MPSPLKKLEERIFASVVFFSVHRAAGLLRSENFELTSSQYLKMLLQNRDR